MLNNYKFGNNSKYLMLLFLSLIVELGGNVKGDTLMVSVHQLRISSSEYINKPIFIKGYLSRSFANGAGRLLLYATKDDSFMRNLASSVPINLHNNLFLKENFECEEHFIEIRGVFRRSNAPNIQGGLSISDISWMMIITEPSQSNSDESINEGICIHKTK